MMLTDFQEILLKKTATEIVSQLEWPDQGGCVSYKGKGKWSFVTCGVQLTPDQVNLFFELSGKEPKVIKPIGQCEDCRYSVKGIERGYREPCLSCKRPIHSNFEARNES